MTTAVNSINAGLISFMASANIGVVPVRMQGIGIAWGHPGSLQDKCVPLLKMDGEGISRMLGPACADALSHPLFADWNNLRGTMEIVSGNVSSSPDRLRGEAGAYESANSNDAAAMLREIALDMDDSKTAVDGAGLIARTEIAGSWLRSLRERSEPANDRIRVSRGLWYGWPDRHGTVYRPLLLKSMDIYMGAGDMVEAASDQLRIALAVSEEELLDADAYAVISEMLKSAATMFNDSWQDKLDIVELMSLASESERLAGGA